MITFMRVCDCGRMEEETKSTGHDGGCVSLRTEESVHSASVSVFIACLRKDTYFLFICEKSDCRHRQLQRNVTLSVCISHFSGCEHIITAQRAERFVGLC